MKRLVFAIVTVFALAASAELKIGTVDMMLLVRNHPAYDTNKNLLKETEEEYERKLDSMKGTLDELQSKGKALAGELKNPMLSEAAKQKAENEILDIQQRYVAEQQKLRAEAMRNQQELSALEARLLKSQAKALKKIISDYAEREGYDMIIDGTAAIYSKKSFDVTDAILKEMKVDPAAARSKDKEKDKDEGK